MKTISSLFLATLIFISQSPQESPELKEAAALTESVVKLFKERKFDEALPPAKRALEIRERLLAPGDPQISTSLSYLADVYIARRDYGNARKTLVRLLQNQELRVGHDDISLAPTLDRVALLHRRQADYDKSEDAYKRAISLKEKAFGADNVEVARSLLGLAEIYRDRGSFDQAAPIYRRTLLIYGQHLGVKSVEWERASEAYSCVAYETKNLEKIKDLTEIWKRFALPNSPEAPAEGIILNGRALVLGRPEYPPEANARSLAGTVVVKVKIDESGRVIAAHDMCQGLPVLSEAAVKAAFESRFSPTKISGMPIKVDGIIQYNFVRP